MGHNLETGRFVWESNFQWTPKDPIVFIIIFFIDMTILHVDQHFPPSATVKKRTHTHRRWVLPELVSPHFSDAVPFLSLGLWENLQETMVETLPQRSAFADFFLMVGDPPDFSISDTASRYPEGSQHRSQTNGRRSTDGRMLRSQNWGHFSAMKNGGIGAEVGGFTYEDGDGLRPMIFMKPYRTISNHIKPY